MIHLPPLHRNALLSEDWYSRNLPAGRIGGELLRVASGDGVCLPYVLYGVVSVDMYEGSLLYESLALEEGMARLTTIEGVHWFLDFLQEHRLQRLVTRQFVFLVILLGPLLHEH